jgi:phosphatidylglycerophosphate synthase
VSQWTTWANLLTALRLALALPTAHAIVSQRWWFAAVLFILAVVSDFLDGYFARKLGQTSIVGGVLDHLTDAIYVTASCWAVAQLGLINPYLCWLIPVAFIQYALDSKSLSGKALRTSRIGKSNGVAYFVVAGVAVGTGALKLDLLLTPLAWFAWLLVASTMLSMLDRAFALLRSN